MEVRDLVKAVGPNSSPAELLDLLEHPGTEEAHLLALLRKRDLAGSVIEAIARHERWNGRRALRAAVVNHYKTPQTLALRLLPWLYWKELLRVTSNYRLRMTVRTAAERQLRDRLSKLELGERINLARNAPPGLILVLIHDTSPRVIASLLTNPRLREVHVLALAENPATSAEVLRVLAESPRWVSREPVKLAVVKNGSTPVHAALRLISSLPSRTVASLVSQHQLRLVVRMGAERMLSRESTGHSRVR